MKIKIEMIECPLNKVIKEGIHKYISIERGNQRNILLNQKNQKLPVFMKIVIELKLKKR